MGCLFVWDYIKYINSESVKIGMVIEKIIKNEIIVTKESEYGYTK